MDPQRLPPGPERDRRLASQPRYGPRRAAPLADLVERWMRSPELKAMRRLAKATSVLAEALGPQRAALARPVGVRRGALVVEVADHLLLAELRNHHQARIETALAEAGTGISRIILVLARTAGPAAGRASRSRRPAGRPGP